MSRSPRVAMPLVPQVLTQRRTHVVTLIRPEQAYPPPCPFPLPCLGPPCPGGEWEGEGERTRGGLVAGGWWSLKPRGGDQPDSGALGGPPARVRRGHLAARDVAVGVAGDDGLKAR